MIAPDKNKQRILPASIKVVGVGGGGGNAVRHMKEANITSAEFIAMNTDRQALMNTKADVLIQIGDTITHGKGAGSDPNVGQAAAENSRKTIAGVLKGADLVFITAGMGGGTGTGAAPIVADVAKNEIGALTIAVVTKPFVFEGQHRAYNAEVGIGQLVKFVDTLIVIPNQKLMEQAPGMRAKEAFKYADDVLYQGVHGISDLIMSPGYINLDFADVKTIMKNKGIAHLGIGKGMGESRATDAVRQAVNSPLLETSIEGAKSVLLNIVCSDDVRLEEIQMAATLVEKVLQPGAHLIFGADLRETQDEEMVVTVIATEFEQKKAEFPRAGQVTVGEAAKPLNVLGTVEASENRSPQQIQQITPQNPNRHLERIPPAPVHHRGNRFPQTHIIPDINSPDAPDFLKKLRKR